MKYYLCRTCDDIYRYDIYSRSEIPNECPVCKNPAEEVTAQDYCAKNGHFYRTQKAALYICRNGCGTEILERNPAKDCFITTACTETMGLPDDCPQLQSLRHFRDTFVSGLPDGLERIREYYELAPRIVQSISAQVDATKVWQKIYRELVEPVVSMIAQDRHNEAYHLYCATFQKLQSQYLQSSV